MTLTELELAFLPYSTVVALESAAINIPTWFEGYNQSTPSPLHRYVLENASDLGHCQEGNTTRDNPDVVRSVMESLWRCRQGGVSDLLLEFGLLSAKIFQTSSTGMPKHSLDMLHSDHILFANQRIDRALLICMWATFGDDTPLRSDQIRNEHFWVDWHDENFKEMVGSRGLAETHMHVNAALTSELAWCLAVPPCVLDTISDLQSWSFFCAAERVEGGPWEKRLLPCCQSLWPWLIWAAITRTLVQGFLGANPVTCDNFASFANKRLRLAASTVMSPAKRSVGFGLAAERWVRSLVRTDSTVAAKSVDMPAAWQEALQGNASAFDKLCGTSFGYVKELHQKLFSLFGRSCGGDIRLSPVDAVMEERGWLVDALGLARRFRDKEREKGKPYSPTAFDQALLQYLRVRNIFHRHIVYPESGGGLRGFSDLFRRGSRYAKGLLSNPQGLTFVFNHLDPGKMVKCAEFRHASAISLNGHDEPHSVKSINERLRALWHFEEQPHQPVGGLVFHFLKRRPPDRLPDELEKDYWRRVLRELQLEGELTRTEVDSWRYGRTFAVLLKQARALHTTWCTPPLNWWILGYDVAGVEEDCPTWPFIAVLGRLLNAAIKTQRDRPNPPGLHFTIHAGEMYTLTLSGLHRIGQAARFLSRCDGGRIGHALALSPHVEGKLDDNIHKEKEFFGVIRNEDWAMAVCWATECLGGFNDAPNELKDALDEVVEELRQCGVCAVSSKELIDAYKGFEDYVVLRGSGFPFMEPKTNSLITRMLYRCSAYDQWAEKKASRKDLPQNILTDLKSKILDSLKRNRITIEACPTSNLAIGLPGGYVDHPAICHYGDTRDPSSGLPLRISLNSDDPLQFATDPATEHWRMWQAAVKKGGMNPDDWLKSRIEDGHDSFFLKTTIRQNRPKIADALLSWEKAMSFPGLREGTGETGVLAWYLQTDLPPKK